MPLLIRLRLMFIPWKPWLAELRESKEEMISTEELLSDLPQTFPVFQPR
jgi:hypothetical protein